MPKICVPLLGATKAAILEEAGEFSRLPADMAEWRVDYFEGATDAESVLDVLRVLRGALGDAPLLVTFRSRREGGARPIEPGDYEALNIAIARSGCADLVDAELAMGDAVVSRVIEAARPAGVKVVASSHDFDKTPPYDEIVGRLVRMRDLGADILKIAVMPRSKMDVLTLLAATADMREAAGRPIVTMSMGRDGVVSRICGETFGSAVTFGSAGEASAPGQPDVRELRVMLEILHKTLTGGFHGH